MRLSVYIEYNDYAACRPNFGALTHRLGHAEIKFSLGLIVLISEELQTNSRVCLTAKCLNCRVKTHSHHLKQR